MHRGIFGPCERPDCAADKLAGQGAVKEQIDRRLGISAQFIGIWFLKVAAGNTNHQVAEQHHEELARCGGGRRYFQATSGGFLFEVFPQAAAHRRYRVIEKPIAHFWKGLAFPYDDAVDHHRFCSGHTFGDAFSRLMQRFLWGKTGQVEIGEARAEIFEPALDDGVRETFLVAEYTVKRRQRPARPGDYLAKARMLVALFGEYLGGCIQEALHAKFAALTQIHRQAGTKRSAAIGLALIGVIGGCVQWLCVPSRQVASSSI